MYWGLYGDNKKFSIINIRLDKNGQLRKKIKTSLRQNKVDRNIKLPDLILSTISLSKTDVGLKVFFRKIGTILELCDCKIGGCLGILVTVRQP